MLVFLLLPCAPAAVRAQALPFAHLTQRNGLLSASINSIMQDADGQLWLMSAEGLSRYDGLGFAHLRLQDGLPVTNVLAADPVRTGAGGLWIGTYGAGLARYAQGRFQTWTLPGDFSANVVSSLVDDGAGGVYCATGTGVVHFRDGRFTALALAGASDRGDCRVLRTGDTLLVVTPTHIHRMDLRTRTVGSLILPASPHDRQVSACAVHRDGTLWIGFDDRTLLRVARDGAVASRMLPGGMARSLAVDALRRVWIGTDNGLLRLADARFTTATPRRFSRAEGLASDNIGALFVDREHTLWFRCGDIGLGSVDLQDYLRFHEVRMPEAYDNTRAAVDGRGEVWVPSGDALVRFHRGDDGEWMRARHALLHDRGNRITGIIADEGDTLWIATLHDVRRLVIARTGDRVTLRSGPSLRHGRELPAGASLFIHIDARRRLFVSMPGRGVFVRHLARGEVRGTLLSTAEGLPENDVRCMHVDDDGSVWFGTYSQGLVRMREERDGTWTRLATLGTGNGLPDDRIRALARDARGRLWIGTRHGGCLIVHDRDTTLLSVREGLVSNAVWAMTRDAAGDMLLATHAGVQRVSVATLRPTPLPEQQTAFAVASVHVAGDGSMFGISREHVGILMPDPHAARHDDAAVRIAGVLVSGMPRDVAALEALDADHTAITIECRAGTLREPHRVRYIHRLLGADTVWQTAASRSITFAALRPGAYVFEVRAITAAGDTSRMPTRVAITIEPQLWRRWWFVALVALLLAGIALALHRRRMAVLRREQAMHEQYARRLIAAEENERRRISSDLHDSIGQNLLIISNGLQHCISGAHDGASLDGHLHELADVARSSVREVREIASALHPHQLERLGLTRAIEAMIASLRHTASCGIDAHVEEVDELLDAAASIAVYRAVQEALSNILRHARATRAEVRIVRDGAWVKVRVHDDGVGFDVAGLDAAQRDVAQRDVTQRDDAQRAGAPESSGLGLAGMRERVRLAGGTVGVRSGAGAGTTLDLTFPCITEAHPT